jgi:polar amino acid transport system permease protein
MLHELLVQTPRFFTYYTAIFLLRAAITTFLLTASGCLIGLLAGSAFAVLRRTSGRWLLPARTAAILYVELFRRVPFLVTLLLVFYGTQVMGLDISLFFIAIIGVCLIATAFISEIVRAGFDAVHANQWDSAAVANLSLFQTLRLVIVPQSWRVILPPAFGFFLLFIKDSALASQIGVLELTYAGKALNNRGFMPLLAFGSILLLYFALSYPLAVLGQKLEMRLARPRPR